MQPRRQTVTVAAGQTARADFALPRRHRRPERSYRDGHQRHQPPGLGEQGRPRAPRPAAEHGGSDAAP
ncbi:MAG: hypothetical protein WKG07_33265 [Hymenobacter sp.]